VIVDQEISPNQARNLERATGAQVLDRTGVIVEIFHRHAHSREAKLQVEMARLKYIAPRLRESSAAGERQQGYGAGESDLELNRRKIRDRIAELKEQLDDIQRDNDQRRSARRDELRVALVGYTNAGKSSLMRALTGSKVLVAEKLFATLDTTVRALQPETKPRVLVSDTVGFIKKLPHGLVASFRSTLAEALEATATVFSRVFLLERLEPAATFLLFDPCVIPVTPVRRRQVRPPYAAGNQVFAIVVHHAKKLIVCLKNATFEIPDENSDDVGIDQAPDLRFAFFYLSTQFCK
jgi:GTPase SAR1 family protein